MGLPHSAPVNSAKNVKQAPMGGAGFGHHIGQRVFPDQTDGCRGGHTGIHKQRHPRRRHMHIHHPHAFALLIIGRRINQAQIKPGPAQHNGQARHPRLDDRRETQEAGWVGETMKHHGHKIILLPGKCFFNDQYQAPLTFYCTGARGVSRHGASIQPPDAPPPPPPTGKGARRQAGTRPISAAAPWLRSRR